MQKNTFAKKKPTSNNPIEVEENDAWAEWMSGFIRPDEEPDEPAVDLQYPVIDQLTSIETIIDDNTKVVATIATPNLLA